jgi:hypothetical protein
VDVFQPLEKSFPIIGKSGPIFPTIGKKFSNHWKTPGPASGAPRGQTALAFPAGRG